MISREVADLATIDLVVTRYEKEFLTFEVTGRRATEVVKAVLKPVLATDAATKEASWSARFERR